MPFFAVEAYVPASDPDGVAACVRRAIAAAQTLAEEGADVRFVRALHLPGDETCFFVFAADVAETAGEAARRAGVEYDRVVEAAEPSCTGSPELTGRASRRSPSGS